MKASSNSEIFIFQSAKTQISNIWYFLNYLFSQVKISCNIDYFLHGFWKARESTYLHRKSIFCAETFWNYIQSFRLPHRNFKLKCRSCPGSKCLQIMQKSCHFSAFFNPVAKKWRNRSFQHLCILPLFTHVQKKTGLTKNIW